MQENTVHHDLWCFTRLAMNNKRKILYIKSYLHRRKNLPSIPELQINRIFRRVSTAVGMAEVIPSLDDLVNNAKKVFQDEFKEDPNIAVFAPGRVNLIGEHVDYCDGFVMPMALPLATVMVGKRKDGEETVIITTNKDADPPSKVVIEMPNQNALVRTLIKDSPKWSNYIRGVISYYQGKLPPAFNAVIVSSVPTGGGLSSSAALEVAAYTFLEALTNETTPLVEKALICQQAEHKFADMPCGIMDQFVSVMAKKDHVLLIDCRSQATEHIPFKDDNIVILITNSNVKHELTGSEYPARRKQCELAAVYTKKVSLRDATQEDIDYLISINADEKIINRARHVVTEIKRTTRSAEYLRKGDFKSFGQCMIESHKSLSKDFEVSCPELDQLVELALEVDGVLGSRMTGGGFGGCTVTLVHAKSVDKVIEHIRKKYSGRPTFYVCKPSDGAGILKKP